MKKLLITLLMAISVSGAFAQQSRNIHRDINFYSSAFRAMGSSPRPDVVPTENYANQIIVDIGPAKTLNNQMDYYREEKAAEARIAINACRTFAQVHLSRIYRDQRGKWDSYSATQDARNPRVIDDDWVRLHKMCTSEADKVLEAHKRQLEIDERNHQIDVRNNKLAEELAAKPKAKIGMSWRDVIEGSNWGQPGKINTTETARGETAQFVYQNRGYLYFNEKGKLAVIQEN